MTQTTAANDDLTALQAELVAERKANTTMAGEIERLRAALALPEGWLQNDIKRAQSRLREWGATDPQEDAKNTLWMATRLREQGCEILELKSEIAELRLCLRQIRDCTSLNSKVGQWARSGLSVFDLSKRYTMRSESDA